MAHQRGLLCSLLVLPDRLFSVLPPAVVNNLKEDSNVQTQISTNIATMLQANKLGQRCQRLLAIAISLSCGLTSLQNQLTTDTQLNLLRDATTVQECWLLFSQHLEDNRVAEIALAAHLRKPARVGLPVCFHRFQGNTDIDVKMMKRSPKDELNRSVTVRAYGTSRQRRDQFPRHGSKYRLFSSSRVVQC
eukprot:5015060-Pleurochrysis_carterae.AAC.1